MGSKLALPAAGLIALGLLVQRDAAADNAKARGLFKQGIDLYKAKNYDKAAAALAKSYELDPKPDALFAQAQAERLGGHCREATVHYHQLLETTQDLPTIKAVQANLALCAKEPEPPPVVVAPEPSETATPEPPAPQIITKTVVRDVPHSDRLATVLFAGGMLAVGGGVGLYIASNGALDDAKHARTLDDHEKFTDRAKTERALSLITGGVGLAMITVAIIRWSSGGPSESRPASDVAVTPTSGGGIVTFSAPW
jgi:tetratricopeptide (TPR) repeat protein